MGHRSVGTTVGYLRALSPEGSTALLTGQLLDAAKAVWTPEQLALASGVGGHASTHKFVSRWAHRQPSDLVHSARKPYCVADADSWIGAAQGYPGAAGATILVTMARDDDLP